MALKRPLSFLPAWKLQSYIYLSSVSYTHLDVYKRQVLPQNELSLLQEHLTSAPDMQLLSDDTEWNPDKGAALRLCSQAPVSYTHLDVYKRQHKYIPFFRNEDFTNHSSKFYPNRNILKIRLGTADSSGSCYGLVKFPVNPSIFLNIACQSVRISRF